MRIYTVSCTLQECCLKGVPDVIKPLIAWPLYARKNKRYGCACKVVSCSMQRFSFHIHFTGNGSLNKFMFTLLLPADPVIRKILLLKALAGLFQIV